MSAGKSLNIEKIATINEFLEEEYALLHINPKNPDVEIPPHLATSPTVTLKISRLFRGITELTDSCVSADLLFNGIYFTCIVPYEAIWGCTSEKGKNILWPDSIPENLPQDLLKADSQPEQSEPSPNKPNSNTKTKRPSYLRRVK